MTLQLTETQNPWRGDDRVELCRPEVGREEVLGETDQMRNVVLIRIVQEEGWRSAVLRRPSYTSILTIHGQLLEVPACGRPELKNVESRPSCQVDAELRTGPRPVGLAEPAQKGLEGARRSYSGSGSEGDGNDRSGERCVRDGLLGFVVTRLWHVKTRLRSCPRRRGLT